jgi:hypothetical protein
MVVTVKNEDCTLPPSKDGSLLSRIWKRGCALLSAHCSSEGFSLHCRTSDIIWHEKPRRMSIHATLSKSEVANLEADLMFALPAFCSFF